jgi:hypothetical protein
VELPLQSRHQQHRVREAQLDARLRIMLNAAVKDLQVARFARLLINARIRMHTTRNACNCKMARRYNCVPAHTLLFGWKTIFMMTEGYGTM